jgi:uncharacterized SAM-binding protein YcdF (DUF218 family)
MPRRRLSARGRVSIRLFLLVLLAAGGVAAWWGFLSLGRILYHEDPLARADVIFVLSGSRVDRAAEAGDLYLEGWAPKVVLSRPVSEGAELALRQRGIEIPTEVDFQRSVLVEMGVPREAIGNLAIEQVATATESDQLLALARASDWHRIIVVTSRLYTARAGLTMRRRFAGSGTSIVMRASRYDSANVDRWWASRTDLRFALFEAQKMVVYWIGLAD